MEYKTGTKFHVCSREDLIEKGWEYDGISFHHDDFPGNSVNDEMIKLEGEILTISIYGNTLGTGPWYAVDENSFRWPVATFLENDFMVMSGKCNEKCRAGMTPIDGWIICKTCGTNLRKIK